MNPELTEEEMRRALFGTAQLEVLRTDTSAQEKLQIFEAHR